MDNQGRMNLNDVPSFTSSNDLPSFNSSNDGSSFSNPQAHVMSTALLPADNPSFLYDNGTNQMMQQPQHQHGLTDQQQHGLTDQQQHGLYDQQHGLTDQPQISEQMSYPLSSTTSMYRYGQNSLNGITNSALARALGAMSTDKNRRPRGEKKPIPVEQKDDKYYERRRRNNEAAKKSRDARKAREDELALRASALEKDNAILSVQAHSKREETIKLREILVTRCQVQQSQQQNPNLMQHQVQNMLGQQQGRTS